jgi:cytochrome c oxidase subunit 2
MITSIFNFLFNLTIGLNAGPSVSLDAPEPWQIGFQDVASPGFEGIVSLHDSVMFYLILILVSVFWIMFSLIRYFNSNKTGIVYKYLNHGSTIELIWTITPALVLIAIAFPSFKLLYTLDEVIDPAFTVKVTGRPLVFDIALNLICALPQ